jgi:hypothetical protein
MNEATAHLAAEQFGMDFSISVFPECKACAIAKAKQRNTPKATLGEKAKEFNRHEGHDLVKINAPEEIKVTINKSN